MIETKIRLSQEELNLITDKKIILTKNAILQKVLKLLGAIAEKQQRFISASHQLLPDELMQTSPKIAKGENYRGLPWQLLDYPRYFKKENSFAIRTMFWWGNFLSITLHISGFYKELFISKIRNHRLKLGEEGFYLYNKEDPWEHHFEDENYLPVENMNAGLFELISGQNNFTKLSFKLPVSAWDEAEDVILKKFNFLVELLGN